MAAILTINFLLIFNTKSNKGSNAIFAIPSKSKAVMTGVVSEGSDEIRCISNGNSKSKNLGFNFIIFLRSD